MTSTAVVYADGSYAGMENGSQSMPYNTLEESLLHVTNGGVIELAAASMSGAITITQAVTLQANSGTATIGEP